MAKKAVDRNSTHSGSGGGAGAATPSSAGATNKVASRAEELLSELEPLGLPEDDAAEAVLNDMIQHFDELDEKQQAELASMAALLDDRTAQRIERKTSLDGELELTVSEDQMAVWLSVTPAKGKGRFVLCSQVVEELQKLRVRATIDEEAVRAALQRVAKTGRPVADVRVCRGQPPQAGDDGRLEWLAGSDKEDASASTGDPRRPKMSVPMVKAGQTIARLVPPLPGKLGENVFGQPIAPPPGKGVGVEAGQNVTYHKDEGVFVADIDGIPGLQNDVLLVRNAYVVAGDVDMTTGSVEFPGCVTIKGSVRDGFYVRARDDIRIEGAVEAAEVTSERGSVSVCQGINGRSRGIVTAAEDIEAQFAENACLYARRNIRLQASVRSQLFAGDSIEVCRGRGMVVAGSLTARHRVDVKVLGSGANVLTEVVLGMSPDEQRALQDLDRSIASFKQTRGKILPTLKQFEAKDSPDQLGEFERRLYARLRKAALVAGYKLRQCEAERENRLEHLCLSNEGVVRVMSQLMPGVCIRIGDRALKVDREQGTSVIQYNAKTDKVECRT